MEKIKFPPARSIVLDRPPFCECDFDSGEPCAPCEAAIALDLPIVGVVSTLPLIGYSEREDDFVSAFEVVLF